MTNDLDLIKIKVHDWCRTKVTYQQILGKLYVKEVSWAMNSPVPLGPGDVLNLTYNLKVEDGVQ